MKKQLPVSILFLAVIFLTQNLLTISAQPLVMTVPDYSYGIVQSQYGTVNQDGVAVPGPYGGYNLGEDERASGIFFANGYRWWGYPSYPLMICGKLPSFDFPGKHGLTGSSGNCSNPPNGYMGSWGSVIADPSSRKIWCLNGAKRKGGPTASFCIPNPIRPGYEICFPRPDNWGYCDSYGYLRRVVVIQSSGALQPGDPVEIKTSIFAEREYDGEGTISSKGVLFLNKPSQAVWWKWERSRDYLSKGDFEDILGTPALVNNMLAKIEVNENNSADSTVSVVVGDTLILELMFYNSIKHVNTGSGKAEGWIGKSPDILFANHEYARTDSVKKIIKSHGNSVSYDLVSLTQGTILIPLTPGGTNVDEDMDGISDAREKGPYGNDSNFDGNSDGIPDYQQANVASFLTYNGENYVTLAIPPGMELSQIKVTDNPSPSDTPADAEFPWGFFDFSIDGLDIGDSLTVTLILHNASSINKYYKYGPTPDNVDPHWYDFTYDGETGARINGNIITLHFVDGQRGDEDLTANGSIKEPGGPAISGITGITEPVEKAGLIVYPNPAGNNITLKLNNILPGNNYLITIFSNTGEVIRQQIIDVCDSNEELNISTNDFPPGLYLITLSGGNFNYNAKFMKLK